MERGISYDFKGLRVVENQPFSYGWLAQIITTLAIMAKPSKTKLVLLGYNMAEWITKITNMADRISFLRAGS